MAPGSGAVITQEVIAGSAHMGSQTLPGRVMDPVCLFAAPLALLPPVPNVYTERGFVSGAPQPGWPPRVITDLNGASMVLGSMVLGSFQPQAY